MQAHVVGSISIEPLFDGTALLDPSMFTVPAGDADVASDWTAHQHHLDPDGKFRVPVGAFLVRTEDRLVLLDAGVGHVEPDDSMFTGGALLDSMRAYGVNPEEIDTVIVSHLHSDHMGWLTNQDAPVFTNATVHIGAADWQFFVEGLGGGKRRAQKLRLIEANVSLVDTDGVTLAPGLTTRLTPGHTPGHLSTVIASGGERMIVLGDAIHCPAQLTELDWQFLYDTDRTLATKTRKALLSEADEPNTRLLPCHFPGMATTRLLRR
jgi:glyoxylase-like metal-dependent hydrolase (beta-lactamase superfamily II)